MSKFVQIGITALRDPATKEFLPAVPLYIEVTPETKQSELVLVKSIGRDLAMKMKQYIDEGGIKESTIK